MAEVIVKKIVDAPIEKVYSTWNYEYSDIYKYHPGLKLSFLLDDSPASSGLGAMRQCDMKDGNWIREKIIRAEQNKLIVVDIYEGTIPTKSAEGAFNFVKINDNKTEVTMTMSFVPKLGLIGILMVPMMKKMFKPMLQSLLDSNASYVESGLQANQTIRAI